MRCADPRSRPSRARVRRATDPQRARTPPAIPGARGPRPRSMTASRCPTASGPRRRPSRAAPPSGGGTREPATRAELPQRIEDGPHRCLECADPLDDLATVAELEVLHARQRVALALTEPVHVVT